MKKPRIADLHIKIIILLVSIIYGILDLLISDKISAPEVKESLFRFLTTTALLIILQEVWQFGGAKGRSARHDALAMFARKNHHITNLVALRVLDDLDRVIRLDDSGERVVIEAQFSILSYLTFWDSLVTKNEGQKKFHVKIIHSCTLDIWLSHPLTTKLLQKQSDFCTAGGEITRILCGSGEATADILKVAGSMKKVGINVFYYDINKSIVTHDFTWDFACVNETKDTVIWDSFARNPRGDINRAIYCRTDEYEGKDLLKLWEEIRQHSTQLL